MSQPDLISLLRAARPIAPPELRERVTLIAVDASAPERRRGLWRRAAIVLVPVAAAIVAAFVLVPRSQQRTVPVAPSAPLLRSADTVAGFAAGAVQATSTRLPAPSTTRLQRYSASLDLELATPVSVSAATQRAVAIAVSLGGYQQTVVVRTSAKTGSAQIVLRVPTGTVREAIRRLSALGRITAEDVSIQDLQVQVNTTALRIAHLQSELVALEAQQQTAEVERRVAALGAQVDQLRRARAAAVRAARYATVELQLATPEAAIPVAPGHGPLHGLGVAFRWIGIGAIYALALGAPLAALLAAVWILGRFVSRRRENGLLSRR